MTVLTHRMPRLYHRARSRWQRADAGRTRGALPRERAASASAAIDSSSSTAAASNARRASRRCNGAVPTLDPRSHAAAAARIDARAHAGPSAAEIRRHGPDRAESDRARRAHYRSGVHGVQRRAARRGAQRAARRSLAQDRAERLRAVRPPQSAADRAGGAARRPRSNRCRAATRLALEPGGEARARRSYRPPESGSSSPVGPEGGFGCQRIGGGSTRRASQRVALGPRVLRAETAALAVCAIAQSLWGDRRKLAPQRSRRQIGDHLLEPLDVRDQRILVDHPRAAQRRKAGGQRLLGLEAEHVGIDAHELRKPLRQNPVDSRP